MPLILAIPKALQMHYPKAQPSGTAKEMITGTAATTEYLISVRLSLILQTLSDYISLKIRSAIANL